MPLTPLALRIEAALPADSSKAEGTAALDLLLFDEDVLELVVDVLEELAVVEEAAAAALLAVGLTG